MKPASVGPKTKGKLRIPVTAAVSTHPSAICSQQSVTVPPEAGAKLAQSLLYGSEEWRAAHASLRSTNEGMNGFLKDGACEALEDPQRRRIRGVVAQSVFLALPLCAANLRKIESFLAQRAAEAAGMARRRPRRRRTRALEEWSRRRCRRRYRPARVLIQTRPTPPEIGDRTTGTVTRIVPSRLPGARHRIDVHAGSHKSRRDTDSEGGYVHLTAVSWSAPPLGQGFVDATCPILSVPRSGLRQNPVGQGIRQRPGDHFPRCWFRIPTSFVIGIRFDWAP